MNAEAIAVVRAQALAQWTPARRDAGGAAAAAGVPGTPADVPEAPAGSLPGAAAPTAGRTLTLPLSALLGRELALPGGADSGLAARAAHAAQGGGRLSALVLDALPGGAYKVAVGDARLILDPGVELQPGELVFLRPTGPAAAQAAPAPGRLPQAELGATSQLVSRLAAAGPATGAALTPIVTGPPLSPVPGSVPQLVAGLRDALKSSGLFYESHLADWVEGPGSRGELLREPQGALAPALARAADPQHPASHHLAPQVEGLVQRQLEVLEFRAVQWQGEAWPGQRADIRIAEDDGGGAHDAAGQPAWSATLRVAMPGLGEVEGRISLAGREVRLALGTTDPQAVRTLAGARAELARALGAQGLTLAEAQVEHDARPRVR